MAKKGITGAKKITVNDALKLYDSTAMIGNVHERFDILTSHPDHLRQDLDWRSFYDGWIEGRFGMYGECTLWKQSAALRNLQGGTW